MAKYANWQSENDETVLIRHATLREDSPLKRSEGGKGHELAHDIVINGPSSLQRLQCKWGSGANELASRYDDQAITCISETSDDGKLSNNKELGAAFSHLASSDRTASAEFCDNMISRYHLDRIITKAQFNTVGAISDLAVASSA